MATVGKKRVEPRDQPAAVADVRLDQQDGADQDLDSDSDAQHKVTTQSYDMNALRNTTPL